MSYKSLDVAQDFDPNDELARVRRTAESLHDPRSQAALDRYLRELEDLKRDNVVPGLSTSGRIDLL